MLKYENKIFATIATSSFSERKQLMKKFRRCELRTDLCALTRDALTNDLQYAKAQSIETIVAIRQPSSVKDALNLLIAAVEGKAEYADIELNDAKKLVRHLLKNSYLGASQKSQTRLIISYHNFKSTPSLQHLENIVAECATIGGLLSEILLGIRAVKEPFVKIATAASEKKNSAKCVEDAERVLKLYSVPLPIKKENLIAFAMGDVVSYTRAASVLRGAPLTYCAAKESVAPGQQTFQELLKVLSPSANFDVKDVFPKQGCRYAGPSKSMAQRALLAAAYASGTSILKNFAPQNSKALQKSIPADTYNALKFIRQTGCKTGSGASLTICSKGFYKWENVGVVDCGESGLLARCIIAMAAATGKKVTIDGKGSLLKRDFSSSVKIIEENGGKCSYRAGSDGKALLPLTVEKGIEKREIAIDARSTSQDITGYLMALPLRKNGGQIIASNIVSGSYIDLTISVMEQFGVTVKTETVAAKNGIANSFSVAPSQKYRSGTICLENDWSSAANLLVNSAIESYKNGEDEILSTTDMTLHTLQPDEKIIDILSECGCNSIFATSSPEHKELYDILIGTKKLRAFKADCTSSPDLIPILCTLAYFCKGRSEIKGVHRLLGKESNRAAAILLEFSRLQSWVDCRGECIEVKGDSFIIEGIGKTGGKENASPRKGEIRFCSHNDHRIALALTVLARHLPSADKCSFTLDNIECITKSWCPQHSDTSR